MRVAAVASGTYRVFGKPARATNICIHHLFVLSKIPATAYASFAVHAAASARGLLYSQVP
ncbi:hypothetical protein CTT39_11675 [Agrobacterium rosae]|nr:hypothetical protein CTT39_11675 [Agrobacterium rosae]